jgi:CheY-like chemotaxis protein
MAHVLVIDDDADVRTIIRRAVQSEGHIVTEAGDGAEGLRLFKERPVDLVITDILMPEREGIETIIELRRQRPELPILAISGGSPITERDGLLMSADLLGATRVLPKPFTLAELRAIIHGLLGTAPD